jgi:hypothetical protein
MASPDSPDRRGVEPGPLGRVSSNIARRALRIGVLFLMLLAGAGVAQIPAMRAVNVFVARHQVGFVSAAIVLLALGFGLFFGGLVAMTIRKGRWMSGEELNEYYRRSMSQPVLGFRVKFAGGVTQFAARDAFTLADLKEARKHGLLWRPPSRNRITRMIGLTLVFLGFCFAQFSLDTAAAKGYALVLLLSGTVWLVTRLVRA